MPGRPGVDPRSAPDRLGCRHSAPAEWRRSAPSFLTPLFLTPCRRPRPTDRKIGSRSFVSPRGARGGLQPTVSCARENLRDVRTGGAGGLLVLPGVRHPALIRRRGRRPAARDDPVHRHRRVHRARRAARPGAAPGRARSLLRGDAGGDRAARRDGREVHRRRGHGRVRRTQDPGGRCAPCGPGRRRDGGGAGRAERRAANGARHPHPRAHGRQHRRGRRGGPGPGDAGRRGRRQRGGAARAVGGARTRS